MPVPRAGELPQPVPMTAGPFVGVRDALELSAQDLSRAASITNGIIPLPEMGGDVMQRPGFIQRTLPSTISLASFTGPIVNLAGYITATGVLTNILLGMRSTAVGTAGFDFFQVDATHNYFPIVYTAPATYNLVTNGGGGSTVQTISDPSLPASRIFQTALGPYILFQQTGGKLWKFEYATGLLTGITDLSANVYGRPAIYYGKLFTILASDRSTLVWSEENDPDSGYQAVGFDNFWTLRQTSNAGMVGVAGTNDALFVFRQNSVTMIQGAVNSDFRAAGTLEGISQTVGTLAPDSIVIVENSVWFLDQFARPQKIQAGRGLVPLWPNCRLTCQLADLTPATQFANWGRYLPELEVVVFRVAQTAGGVKHLAFSSRTEECVGQWSATNYTTNADWGGVLYDSDGRAMFAETRAVASPTKFITQKADVASDQTDQLDSTASPTYEVETPFMDGDPDMASNFSEVTVTGTILGSPGVPTMQYQVRGSPNAAYTSAVTMTAPITRTGAPNRYTAGIAQWQTRYGQVKVSHSVAAADGARPTTGTVRLIGTAQRVSSVVP